MSGGGISTDGCRKVTCIKCGYTWCTRSLSNYVTCPHCQYKTPVIPFRNEINKLFDKLKMHSKNEYEYRVYEVMRVSLLSFVREGKLPTKLLIEILKEQDHYTNK